jgi:hypothetical protein
MTIESKYLYNDLELMTKQMLDKSILLLQQLTDEDLKALQKKNIVYFLTARMLFLQSTEVGVTVDSELLNLAKQEYELAQAAGGMQLSPLFEVDLDYSQFTVRGHYTRSEELSKYFKTMMWFGTAPLAFVDKDKQILLDNVLQALLITYTTIADSEQTCDAKLWSEIYQPTSQYVGLSDDINVFSMNGLRSSVFGDNENPDIYNDENYRDKLEKAVKVSGKIMLPNGEVAPSGGVTVNIITFAPSYVIPFVTVAIPEGQNSVVYELYVLPNVKCLIKYSVEPGSKYLSTYYSANDSSSNNNKLSSLEIGTSDITNINGVLKRGIQITGKISLPNGQKAPAGGLNISIDAVNNKNEFIGDNSVPALVTINENQNSVEYSLLVSPIDNVNDIKIKYSILNLDTNYEWQGYYCSTGTTAKFNNAEILKLENKDISNINITVI